MSAILIQPKDAAEFQLLHSLLAKMKIAATVLSEEDWEDLGLSMLMREVERTDTVSREAVMAKLRPA